MNGASLLDRAGAGWLSASTLAEVISVQDPEQRSRVQVRLLSFDGAGEQDGPVWARVAVPFAGDHRGAFLLPDVGDEVLVTFVNGDPRFPVVVGGLWNGGAPAPESIGGRGDRVDRWTIVGKAGTRIAIEEAVAGRPTISLTTPGGVSGTLADTGAGTIELKAAGATVTIDSAGVTVQAPARVSVQASQVQVTAGQVKVDAAVADFSGIVKCQTLVATTVVSSVYTPGAGNVW